METYLFTQSIMDPQGKNTLWKLIRGPMAKNIMLNELITNYYFFMLVQENISIWYLTPNITICLLVKVYLDLSTDQVLTTEYITGLTIDRCVDLPAETRNYIAQAILKLVFRKRKIILKRFFLTRQIILFF